MPTPMEVKVYPCDYPIPEDKTVDGYTKLKETDCSFCPAMCEAPDIDSSIGFFDGFDATRVYITYGILVGISIIWQIYICACKRPKVNKEWEDFKAN